MTDATKMPLIHLAQMVADWLGMAKELKSDPYQWAINNINKRWKFNKEQENLIYEFIKKVWGEK